MPRPRARIHALRPGRWPASPQPLEVTPELIREIAERYDPELYPAPVVLGHPEHDDPAWGEVLGAQAQDDGLWLDVELVPELADLVRERRYRNVSVSLWPPDAVGNPKPGGWTLRHLGFLGAVPPACKHLTPLRLGDSAGAIVLDVEDNVPTEQQPERAAPPASPPDQAVELAEKLQELAAREAKLREREVALAARERALKRAEIEREVAEFVSSGRVAEADAADVVALLEAADQAGPVTLADASSIGLGQLVRRVLSRIRSAVPTGELIMARAADANPEAELELPRGFTLGDREKRIISLAEQMQAEGAANNRTEAMKLAAKVIDARARHGSVA